MKFTSYLVVALATLACLWAWPAAAEWPHDPTENVPICNTIGAQYDELLVSDGAGGAIIVWRDLDVFAQRVDANGVVQWTTDGVALCTANGTQWYHDIVTDGAGGAIVTWEDQRTIRDIYAQRIDASGNVMWTEDGVLVCGAGGSQYKPKIATDGAGGAIIVWQDARNTNQDIYAQRIDASGAVQWVADGISVCTDAANQYEPRVAGDGGGGAYFAWQDARSGSNYDIYALNVNSAGVSTWTTDGEVMCAAAGHQTMTEIMADGAGGAIMSWWDERGVDMDIYAQRVVPDGDVQWGADGVAVCTETGVQANHRMVSDGAVGAIVVWDDDRPPLGEGDIYAQRISVFGTAEWTTNGVAVCTAPNRQYWPRITTDSLGGAIITWPDYRYGSGTSVYAQMINADGVVLWDVNGAVICSNMSASDSELVYDGAGGAIIAWEDLRNDDSSKDIYAQKIERNGFLGYPSGRPTTAVDHPDDQGDQIVFSWNASYLDEWPMSDVEFYSVWRRYGGTGARRVAPAVLPRGSVDLETLAREGWVHVDDVDAMQLPEYGYVVPSFGDSTESGTIWTDLMVIAHSTSVGDQWVSEAITGYSVDNLAPGAPLALGAEVASSDVELTWSPSGYYDEDLSEYNVYRSEVTGFVPDETTFVGAATDTVYTDVDPGPATWHYVVSAIDVHGNEGEVSNEASAMVGTGVDDPVVPAVFALRGNHPNPFNPSTRIAFDIPEAASVRLDVYSPSGRLVTTLADRVFEAGRHNEMWDGSDSSGHELPSGVYLVRLKAGADVATHPMVLLK